jgi:hypothetical protein
VLRLWNSDWGVLGFPNRASGAADFSFGSSKFFGRYIRRRSW